MTLVTLALAAPPFGESTGIPVAPLADRSFVDPRAGTLIEPDPADPSIEVVDPRAGTIIIV